MPKMEFKFYEMDPWDTQNTDEKGWEHLVWY